MSRTRWRARRSTTLLDVLREELGITSPKAGCEQGGCGACTVLVDGEPRRSCLTAVGAIDGAEVTTVEGLGAPESLAPVQQAFTHHYAAQCGFCTSGMMIAAEAYVRARRHRRPGGDPGSARGPRLPLHGLRQDHRRRRRPRARRRVRPDRHGGERRDDEPRRCPVKAVGARLPRYDGIEHVTGRTMFVDDVRVPGMLWAKALRSPVHSAEIKGLDVSKAEAMPGVHAVDHLEGRAAPRVRPPLGARDPGRRAAAREGRRAVQGPADRARRRRGRGDGERGGRRDRARPRGADAAASTSGAPSTTTRRRSTTGATGTRTSRTRWTGVRSARARSTRRSTRPT